MITRVVAALGLASLLTACTTTSPEAGPAAGGRTPAIRTVHFTGPFHPTDELSLDGAVWLVGGEGTGCAVERFDPATLATRTFPLAGCAGGYVTAGAGHLYLMVVDHTPGTDNEDLHLETFDTATGRSTVMAPVAATAVGSGIAHMTFAYGLGSLWLYPWGDHVLRLSPSTGAVVGSVGGVTSGGGHAVMAAGPTDMWMAEGPGGERLFRFTAASPGASVVYRAPAPGSLVWVSVAAGKTWAEVVAYSGPAASRASTRLVALDRSGHVLSRTPPEDVGEAGLADAGGELWSAGLGMVCQGPLRLWRVDTATGRSAVVGTLAAQQTCFTAAAQIVAAGGYAFVLNPADPGSSAGALYRVSP